MISCPYRNKGRPKKCFPPLPPRWVINLIAKVPARVGRPANRFHLFSHLKQKHFYFTIIKEGGNTTSLGKQTEVHLLEKFIVCPEKSAERVDSIVQSGSYFLRGKGSESILPKSRADLFSARWQMPLFVNKPIRIRMIELYSEFGEFLPPTPPLPPEGRNASSEIACGR